MPMIKHNGFVVQVPLVHLNGTSQRELVNQLRDVKLSINMTVQALREAAPHGRDYPAEDWHIAKHQHSKRIEALQEMGKEIEAMAIAIIDQRRVTSDA